MDDSDLAQAESQYDNSTTSTKLQRYHTKMNTEFDVIRRGSIGHLKESMVEYLTQHHSDHTMHRTASGIFGNSDKPATIRKIVNLDLKNKELPDEIVEQCAAEEKQSVWIENSYIFNPEHFHRKCWDLLLLLPSVLYTAIRVPYAIGFNS